MQRGFYYYLTTKHPEIRCWGIKKNNNTDDIPKCLFSLGCVEKCFGDYVGYRFFYRIFPKTFYQIDVCNHCVTFWHQSRSFDVFRPLNGWQRHTHTHTELIINYCYDCIGYHLLCRVQWISNCIHWIGRRVRCAWSAVSVYKAIK